MLKPEYYLLHLHHLHFQPFRFRPPSLIPKGRCQAGYADQGVWMLRLEYRFGCPHHLHFQLFRLRPSSLVHHAGLLEHSVGDCLPVVIVHYSSTQDAGRLTDDYMTEPISFFIVGTPPPIPTIKPKRIKGNVVRMRAATVAAEMVPYTPDGRQATTIF